MCGVESGTSWRCGDALNSGRVGIELGENTGYDSILACSMCRQAPNILGTAAFVWTPWSGQDLRACVVNPGQDLPST